MQEHELNLREVELLQEKGFDWKYGKLELSKKTIENNLKKAMDLFFFLIKDFKDKLKDGFTQGDIISFFENNGETKKEIDVYRSLSTLSYYGFLSTKIILSENNHEEKQYFSSMKINSILSFSLQLMRTKIEHCFVSHEYKIINQKKTNQKSHRKTDNFKPELNGKLADHLMRSYLNLSFIALDSQDYSEEFISKEHCCSNFYRKSKNNYPIRQFSLLCMVYDFCFDKKTLKVTVNDLLIYYRDNLENKFYIKNLITIFENKKLITNLKRKIEPLIKCKLLLKQENVENTYNVLPPFLVAKYVSGHDNYKVVKNYVDSLKGGLINNSKTESTEIRVTFFSVNKENTIKGTSKKRKASELDTHQIDPSQVTTQTSLFQTPKQRMSISNLVNLQSNKKGSDGDYEQETITSLATMKFNIVKC